ncbi:MAG: hypothetical protein IJY47_00220 [Clostridia bacterium]|nr:hypothetical protein [Clostridia bacterium]
MKNRDIYENALRLLAQSADSGENEDYEERAPFLIASFCTEAMELDRFLRESVGESPAAEFGKVWMELSEEFPLLERLAPIACLYVAAMLVLEENADLSDRLYDLYSQGISAIWNGITSVIDSIKEQYFSD